MTTGSTTPSHAISPYTVSGQATGFLSISGQRLFPSRGPSHRKSSPAEAASTNVGNKSTNETFRETRPEGIPERRGSIAPEERGALLEGWVLHLLRAHGEERDLYEDLRYWAPHPANRTEMDFLLRRGAELAAIEVKTQPRYHTGLLAGLRAVAELPGLVRRVLIYGGARSFRTQDRIEVWSTERFHRALSKDMLWP